MLQRIVIAGTLVYLYKTPVIQCAILIVMNIVLIVYLVCVRPHRNAAILATTAIDEVVIMVTVIVFAVLHFYNDTFTADRKRTIGLAIVAVILLSAASKFALIFYKAFMHLTKSCRERNYQKKLRHR